MRPLFFSGLPFRVQRACSEPSGSALLHIRGLPKGSVLSCSRFVGRTPTESKPKIQGFAPTDKQPAACLSCARGENMKKIRLLPLLAIFLWLSSYCITSAQDPGPP